MPKKTNLPQRIVVYLRRHPTANRRQISEALGVGYQAVQKHLRRLEDDGLVLPGFLVSDRWDADRHEFWIFIATRYDRELAGEEIGADYQGALCRQVAAKLTDDEEYAEEISFGSIRILLGGEWDLVLRVFARDPDAVGRFVTRYLRAQRGIVRTSTAWTLGERGRSEQPP